MHYYSDARWYAIRVKYRHESVVEKSLTNKNLSPLNLTFQTKGKGRSAKKTLIKPFFPGYMFINTELDRFRHVEILKTPGIVEIIKNSEGPVPIPDDQINNIEQLKDYKGKIYTFTEFAAGMLVQVISGPLKGLFGSIDEMHKKYIKLSIDSIPGAIGIQIPYDDLQTV